MWPASILGSARAGAKSWCQLRDDGTRLAQSRWFPIIPITRPFGLSWPRRNPPLFAVRVFVLINNVGTSVLFDFHLLHLFLHYGALSQTVTPWSAVWPIPRFHAPHRRTRICSSAEVVGLAGFQSRPVGRTTPVSSVEPRLCSIQYFSKSEKFPVTSSAVSTIYRSRNSACPTLDLFIWRRL